MSTPEWLFSRRHRSSQLAVVPLNHRRTNAHLPAQRVYVSASVTSVWLNGYKMRVCSVPSTHPHTQFLTPSLMNAPSAATWCRFPQSQDECPLASKSPNAGRARAAVFWHRYSVGSFRQINFQPVLAHERMFWSVFGQSFPSLIVSRLVSSGVVRQQRNRQNEVRKKMRIPSVIGRKKDSFLLKN